MRIYSSAGIEANPLLAEVDQAFHFFNPKGQYI
jgi:hypothetical protein